jgi:bcr-type benzoyl-CoA reductase subunit C
MTTMNTCIQRFVEDARNPKQTIANSVKATGKKPFGCFPIYVPEEIVYAAGLLPVGLWGGKTDISQADRYIQSFCCSIMRTNMELGIRGEYDFLAGMVIPTYCDTMKAVLANWKIAAPNTKMLCYSVIQNRQSSGSLRFIMDEMESFKEGVEKLAGKTVTEADLEEAFALYEDYRAAMRRFTEIAQTHPVTIDPKTRHMIIKSAYYCDKREYTARLNELIALLAAAPEETVKGPRVVITGLLAEPEQFLDLFTENGYAFVEDDLAQESRQFRVPARPSGTAMERMAYRLIDLKGCTFFYEEDKTRGTILADMVRRHKADGVVYCLLKFCDPDEFDYPVCKKELEEAGIPILYLEIEQNMDSVEQLRTRIQSFAEMMA